MVRANIFSEVGGQFVQRMFSGILWFGLIVIIIAILGFLGWYFFIYKRKFDIKVKIISERAEERNKIVFDKAAILIGRKDGSKYLRLWSLKMELPVPKFNIIQSSNEGDYIELYRTADGIFYYLTPQKIDKKCLIRADGKMIPMADQVSTPIDPEMDFWAVKRKKINKGMFDTESPWMKLLPYIPYILGGVITIFVLYLLMRYLPNILAELKDLAATLAQSQHATITTGV